MVSLMHNMRLKRLEIGGFKSFAKKSVLDFSAPISAVVGPNGSGKSNVAESLRFVLGEQSVKALRGKRGEDMIFNGSEQAGRLGRAKVTVVFDNVDRILPIDFDEVILSREVHRDNSNVYTINGSKVRLKDVIETLSALNIGASSHHIISQGEADRILNATPRDRKVMIEDALGLKVYHWKISESEKRLDKTEGNMKEIETLRRELAPQIKYLKKQVEKIEKAKEMRGELALQCKEYLKREELYLAQADGGMHEEKGKLKTTLDEIDGRLSKQEETLKLGAQEEALLTQSRKVQQELGEVRGKRASMTREIGRIEGALEYAERRAAMVVEVESEIDDEGSVAVSEVKTFIKEAESQLSQLEDEGDIVNIRIVLQDVKQKMSTFVKKITEVTHTPKKPEAPEVDTNSLAEQKESLEDQEKGLVAREGELQDQQRKVFAQMDARKNESRDAERELFEIKTQRNAVLASIATIETKQQQVEAEKQSFAREKEDAVSYVGVVVHEYEQLTISEDEVMREERQVQQGRRREIERMKMRLEDMGVDSAAETLNEFNETQERALYLEREFDDLTKSAESLRELIIDLSGRLEEEFNEGVLKINKQFQDYFAIMFGGGKASLIVVDQKKRRKRNTDDTLTGEVEDEEEPVEKGLEIDVSLPRKKIKGLTMLSGGERALTSIALLFAVSQVKPPPFMVLDETDAALDEANSRRYGDMLDTLAEYSQIVVITHNRETMGRAGVLYGVTMGTDAVSKLLSVKFEEAVKVAK